MLTWRFIRGSLLGSARCLPAQGQVGHMGAVSPQGMLLELGL